MGRRAEARTAAWRGRITGGRPRRVGRATVRQRVGFRRPRPVRHPSAKPPNQARGPTRPRTRASVQGHPCARVGRDENGGQVTACQGAPGSRVLARQRAACRGGDVRGCWSGNRGAWRIRRPASIAGQALSVSSCAKNNASGQWPISSNVRTDSTGAPPRKPVTRPPRHRVAGPQPGHVAAPGHFCLVRDPEAEDAQRGLRRVHRGDRGADVVGNQRAVPLQRVPHAPGRSRVPTRALPPPPSPGRLPSGKLLCTISVCTSTH